jgi:hypothetical protein
MQLPVAAERAVCAAPTRSGFDRLHSITPNDSRWRLASKIMSPNQESGGYRGGTAPDGDIDTVLANTREVSIAVTGLSDRARITPVSFAADLAPRALTRPIAIFSRVTRELERQ